MQNAPKKSPLSVGMLAGVVAVVVLGYGLYSFSHSPKSTQETKPAENKEASVQSAASAPAEPVKTSAKSSTFNADQRQEIQDIFLALIREKPEMFMGAMNEGMQAQQDKLRIELEKNATDLKDKLIGAGIALGSPQAETHLIALIDPMCPHCHEFHKLISVFLQKRQDVAVHVIPIAILGPNSVAMSKILLSASKQGVDKMNTFFNKFINKTADVDRAKLLQMAKDSGLDTAKLEKDELSEEVEKTLVANTQLAEQLKIPGVPTIFGVNKEGKASIIPPMDLDGFNKVIDSLKGAETAAPAVTNSPVKNNKDES